MPDDYTSAFRSEQAAERYEQSVYEPGSYDSFMADLQGSWLRKFVSHEFRGEAPVLHDFACGTGRIVEALTGMFRSAHGYDTSSDMLAVASQKGLPAQFHLIQPGDLPSHVDVGEGAGASVLVTIFRLLLNSPDAVRADSMRFAASILRQAEHGVLVVNNHGNRWSLRQLARLKPLPKDGWFHALSTREVRRLAADHGLVVKGAYGFGLLPRSLHASRTRSMARRLDRWTAGRRWLAPVAIDIVYVMRMRPDPE